MANPARVMEVRDDVIAFDTVVRRNDPYPHIVSPRFYTEQFADILLGWLETESNWTLNESMRYEQYELGFSQFAHCTEIAGLWDGGVLAHIRDGVRRAIGFPVSSRINISAHKMFPGQQTYIHTDKVEHETHRVVVPLNRGRAPDSGGNLVLLSGSRPADISVVFKQISNSAVGFALDPKSFHAVSRVKAGTRFTIIYTFFSDAVPDLPNPNFFVAS
jgi:Rps23 Pro-64 3,4-dihydroxylase Tpa1-like proline 4-hydroxylase